ncbi:hypothetical protein [Xanthomonas graminis]|uniref:hypothetical protein n=1 Tax=Xanthomonas graminis TaxID=3390026 RepID=UPI00118738BC|nr:hypothetical protein [Xanthomonas translucens]
MSRQHARTGAQRCSRPHAWGIGEEHATLRAEHGRDWRHSAIARAGSLRKQIRRRIRIGQRRFGIASSCSRAVTELRVAFIQTLRILSMDTK